MYVVTVGHVMSEPHPQSSWQPVSAEEFADWFDSDGRLVREVTMRQRVFEGTCVSARFPTSFLCCLPVTSPPSLPHLTAGIHPSCRRRLWKFLFELYPVSSTHREQKTIDLENRSQYQALCHRWEVLDKAVQLPDDDLSEAPPYMELSDDEDDSNSCTPSGGGASRGPGRAVSDPIPEELLHSHSNGSMGTRLKSPSVENIDGTPQCNDAAVQGSGGQEGAETVAMAADSTVDRGATNGGQFLPV